MSDDSKMMFHEQTEPLLLETNFRPRQKAETLLPDESDRQKPGSSHRAGQRRIPSGVIWADCRTMSSHVSHRKRWVGGPEYYEEALDGGMSSKSLYFKNDTFLPSRDIFAML